MILILYFFIIIIFLGILTFKPVSRDLHTFFFKFVNRTWFYIDFLNSDANFLKKSFILIITVFYNLSLFLGSVTQINPLNINQPEIFQWNLFQVFWLAYIEPTGCTTKLNSRKTAWRSSLIFELIYNLRHCTFETLILELIITKCP